MSIELEHRLVDLGGWLDQAAPEVRLAELGGRTAIDEEPTVTGDPTGDVADPAVPVLPIASRPARRTRPLVVAAAAVVLALGGLVAVSRRSSPTASDEPATIDGPSTTAASAVLGVAWPALVSPLLPSGFTAVATLPSPGQLVVAVDGVGRTITVTFLANGAEQARREWEGMAGVTLSPGVAAGDGSSAVVVTAGDDALSADCWLGDDVCSSASIDPPVDVRPMLEALARAITDATRAAILERATTSTLDGTTTSAVFGRFGTALGTAFTLSTGGGVVARQSWTQPANGAQRVSLQIVPAEVTPVMREVVRSDLVVVTAARAGVLFTAVARTTDGTPVAVRVDELRELLLRSIDSSPTADPTSTTATTVAAVAEAPPPLPPLIDALNLGYDGVAQLNDATQRLIATCMGAKGLAYDVAPFAGLDEGIGSMGEWFGPGLTVTRASASGYHTVVDYDQAAEQRYMKAAEANTARARADDAYAHESEVCALAASHAVDDADPYLTAQTNTANALVTVLAPARDADGYQQALDAWRTCARAVGIDDDTPRRFLPFGTAVGAPPTAPATPDERERAVADARCREEARLQDALRASAVALIDAWLVDRPDLVSRLQQGKVRLLERVRRLLDENPAPVRVLGTVTLPDGTRAGVGVSDTAFCLTTGDGTVAGCDGAPASLSPGQVMVSGWSDSGPLVYGVADAGLTARVLSDGTPVAVVQSTEAVDGHVVFVATIPAGTRLDVELRRRDEVVKRFDRVSH